MLRDLSLQAGMYASGRHDLINDFYLPCLDTATSYDRAVGYFRSSVLALVGVPFSQFAQRGGRARFLCSPEFSAADVRAIQDGYDIRTAADEALQKEMSLMLERPEGVTVLSLLATLVSIGCLDVRVAIKSGGGIFHHKIGLFTDEVDDQVSFLGSTNESWSGWSPSGNDESFETFASWGPDADRVKAHREFFESAWEGLEPNLQTLPLPEASRNLLLHLSDSDGIDSMANFVAAGLVQRPPLFPHQQAALDDWTSHGHRGILEHATGSGKTITALSAARRWLQAGRPVLVIVPTEILHRQWVDESSRFLGDLDCPVLLVGVGHGRGSWERRLHAFLAPNGGGRLVISTLQTASTPEFLSKVADPSELLIIVDEAHRAGSPNNRRIFDIDAEGRLGLTATPRRLGDPEGTAAINKYFERTLIPIYTLRDAIAEGRLCRYTYHIDQVRLSDDEEEEWVKLSEEIGRAAAISKESPADQSLSDRLMRLLIKRARIVKQAAGKVPVACEVIKRNFQPGQAWLVYCDSQEQLNDMVLALRNAGLDPSEYHSNMSGDRVSTISHYTMRGGIMVAIRCLDEGVDIPRATHAMILASSRNLREFIQRRGRVLRRAPGKHFAQVHDLIALPTVGADTSIEARLVAPELARAVVFAKDSMNQGTLVSLQGVASRLGLDLDLELEREDESHDESPS